MASAQELVELFSSLPTDEKQKFMQQLTSTPEKDAKLQQRSPVVSAPTKKAVNGFMAFRSYYSILFSGLQQKERSPFLRRLYDADPFHAEWDFVARIYSHVRNEVLKLGKQAPIRAFLASACPVMNMVSPQEYLATCGWEIKSVGSGGNKRHELTRHEGAEDLVRQLRKTTPSLNGFDLLLQCLANGYDVHNAQEVLCHMMERQEHLMTKAFLVEDDRASQHSVTTATVKTPLSESFSKAAPGDFFSWAVEKPSPTTLNLILGSDEGETELGHQHGGNLMHFEGIHLASTRALDRSNEMMFRLDMPMGAYKYASSKAHSVNEMDLALQLDDIAGHSDSGGGPRNPFDMGSIFEDDYMNTALDFGNGDHAF